VRKVSSGNRTILAGYCREDVASFDRAIKGYYTPEEAIQLKDDRVKMLRNADKNEKKRLKSVWVNEFIY
jgi:hypothetical protein